jgi:hypothetical protein
MDDKIKKIIKKEKSAVKDTKNLLKADIKQDKKLETLESKNRKKKKMC